MADRHLSARSQRRLRLQIAQLQAGKEQPASKRPRLDSEVELSPTIATLDDVQQTDGYDPSSDEVVPTVEFEQSDDQDDLSSRESSVLDIDLPESEPAETSTDEEAEVPTSESDSDSFFGEVDSE